jgi:nitrate reductase beta subunit
MSIELDTTEMTTEAPESIVSDNEILDLIHSVMWGIVGDDVGSDEIDCQSRIDDVRTFIERVVGRMSDRTFYATQRAYRAAHRHCENETCIASCPGCHPKEKGESEL